MAQTDMALDLMRDYRPGLDVPADLDDFWQASLDDARKYDLEATFTPVETGLTVISTFDVRFAGYGGSPVRGWLHLPAGTGTAAEAGAASPLPVVVEYVGYGGGRGLPHERLLWAAAGYAHLLMDTRGQGSTWSVGDTPDPDPIGAPRHPGFTTAGILDPATYYYRRVYVDAARAIEAARAHPGIDPRRVAVTGGSQGGALAIAAASLVPDVAAAMPDVPFMSDLPRSITMTDSDPYAEIARYLKAHRDHVDRALRTLSYFDVAILGRRAKAPALFSVGLMDLTCLPSTVFAAANWYGGPSEIVEYPFNDHEGGEAFHDLAKLRWLKPRLAG